MVNFEQVYAGWDLHVILENSQSLPNSLNTNNLFTQIRSMLVDAEGV